jgi:hypothetical protein
VRGSGAGCALGGDGGRDAPRARAEVVGDVVGANGGGGHYALGGDDGRCWRRWPRPAKGRQWKELDSQLGVTAEASAARHVATTEGDSGTLGAEATNGVQTLRGSADTEQRGREMSSPTNSLFEGSADAEQRGREGHERPYSGGNHGSPRAEVEAVSSKLRPRSFVLDWAQPRWISVGRFHTSCTRKTTFVSTRLGMETTSARFWSPTHTYNSNPRLPPSGSNPTASP